MGKKNRGMIASIKLFLTKSCYTTLLALMLALTILIYPSIKRILIELRIIELPSWVLFVLIAVITSAILVDQWHKRFHLPDQIERDISEHTRY